MHRQHDVLCTFVKLRKAGTAFRGTFPSCKKQHAKKRISSSRCFNAATTLIRRASKYPFRETVPGRCSSQLPNDGTTLPSTLSGAWNDPFLERVHCTASIPRFTQLTSHPFKTIKKLAWILIIREIQVFADHFGRFGCDNFSQFRVAHCIPLVSNTFLCIIRHRFIKFIALCRTNVVICRQRESEPYVALPNKAACVALAKIFSGQFCKPDHADLSRHGGLQLIC